MDSRDLGAFIDEAGARGHLRVERDLGNGFVELRVSEAERRQALQDIRCVEDATIELLRNARDAGACTVFLATCRSGDARLLTVVDDGEGIPSSMHEEIFAPRVTSKLDSFAEDDWGVHGRGMALYSIRENSEAAFVAASAPGAGCALRVEFLASRVPERKDQSTLPSLGKSAEGVWELGPGPRNIARSVAEFALVSRERCTVYFGSPVEIAATLCAYGARFAKSLLARSLSSQDAPVAKRLSLCADAAEFAACAQGLGLDVSLRSAYRILQGGVAPLRPLLAVLASDTRALEAGASKRAVGADLRGLKIADEDLAAFSTAARRAWRDLAEAYYLEPDVEPHVRVSRDEVRVTFPVRKQL